MTTTEIRTPDTKGFVPRVFPWILATGMLVCYLATLHHWVTPRSLSSLGDISGWNQEQRLSGPLTFVVTYPFKWISAKSLPLAMNVFAAICAALTLCQLARSVAILPHDRTHDQREREHSDFSILTTKTAWIPPLFAVVVCGLQMTFWENSIQANFEMFDLLIFACVIRCLLEYRIDPRQSWLTKFGLVYGIGMANNWALVGFLPLFLAALIWIKGIASLNTPFIVRTFGGLLVGFCVFFFVLPVINGLTHAPVGFGGTIHSNLALYRRVFFSFPRITVAVLSLTSLLPILVIGIRWASYFGDHSPLGIFLATATFHIVHALLLVACLWVALDSPLSARQIGFGVPFLSFYYLAAISVGYFTGYFLLIFATRLPTSESAYYPFLKAVNVIVTLLLAIVLLGMPFVLVYKNYPHLQDEKAIATFFGDYFEIVAKALPPAGTVVLSDDPASLAYLHHLLERDGNSSKYLLVDTHQFGENSGYLHNLAKRSPKFQINEAILKHEKGVPTVPSTIEMLDDFNYRYGLYYLDPSFGFFFEHFYLEPHGLIYRMKVYPEKTWDAPLATPELVEENQAFWKQTSQKIFPAITNMLARPAVPAKKGHWEKFLASTHLKMETPALVGAAGRYYSRALDYWGVELQKLGDLTNSAKTYSLAISLNGGNISAIVNRYSVDNLVSGKQSAIAPKNVEELLSPHNGWVAVLGNDGPIDEPNFRDELYSLFARGQIYRQAVQQLDRIKAIAPADLRVPVQLAQLLIYVQTYTNTISHYLPLDSCFSEALTNAQYVLDRAPNDPNALFLKGTALIQLKEYQQAISPLSSLLDQTNNAAARLNRAIAYYKLGNLAAAKPDYEKVNQDMPGTYQVYYALGDIAYREKDFPTAIKNYELFMSKVPGQSTEGDMVAARLKELKAGAH